MPKFRSIAILIAFPALLAAQAPAAPAEAPAPAKHHHRHAKSKGFVGCTETKLFHKPDCAHVADIERAGTKVMFTNRAEAVQAGYKPCDDCKP